MKQQSSESAGKPSPRLIEADRVYHLVNDVHYRETLGQWMRDEMEAATALMADEDDPIKNAKARGAYMVLRQISDRITSCLDRRERAAMELVKNISEKANE